jgi:hypothetical protein
MDIETMNNSNSLVPANRSSTTLFADLIFLSLIEGAFVPWMVTLYIVLYIFLPVLW